MALSKTFSSSQYVGKDGRNLVLTVSDYLISNSNTSNQTMLKWSLSTLGGSSGTNYYDTYCYLSINGQQLYFSNGTANIDGYNGWIVSNTGQPDGVWYDGSLPPQEYTCAKNGFNISGSFIVDHELDGTKTVDIIFLVGIFYPVVKDCGGSFTLNPIDRGGAVIIQNNIVPSYNSCIISASSDTMCRNWGYSRRELPNGSWTSIAYFADSTTAVSQTISGLTPGKSYEFQIFATAIKNDVTSVSNIKEVKLLNSSVLTYFTKTIVIDSGSNPVVDYSLTAESNQFFHKIVLAPQTGGNPITIPLSRGADTHSGSFSVSRDSLLSWIGNSSFSKSNIVATLYTCTDDTYNNIVGECTTITGITVRLDRSIAYPTLSSSSIAFDTVTGSYNISLNSNVRIDNIIARGTFGASLVSLTAKLGNTSKNLSLTNGSFNGSYIWGSINSVLYGTIILTATDTRGLKTSVPVFMQLINDKNLVEDSDYNAWVTLLNKHYSGKDYDNKYYVSGTTSKNFNIQNVSRGNLAKAGDITFGDSPDFPFVGLAGAVKKLPHGNGAKDYYKPVATYINAIAGYESNVLVGGKTLEINSNNVSVNTNQETLLYSGDKASVTPGTNSKLRVFNKNLILGSSVPATVNQPTKTLNYTGDSVTISNEDAKVRNVYGTVVITTQHGNLNIENLIMKNLKDNIDNYLDNIDNIVLFNLVEG